MQQTESDKRLLHTLPQKVEEMKQSIPGYDDSRFFELLPAYDTQKNLWNWYCCYEEDPLPVKEEIAA